MNYAAINFLKIRGVTLRLLPVIATIEPVRRWICYIRRILMCCSLLRPCRHHISNMHLVHQEWLSILTSLRIHALVCGHETCRFGHSIFRRSFLRRCSFFNFLSLCSLVVHSTRLVTGALYGVLAACSCLCFTCTLGHFILLNI